MLMYLYAYFKCRMICSVGNAGIQLEIRQEEMTEGVIVSE